MLTSKYHKAKTYEEKYSTEKAKEIKAKISRPGRFNSQASKWVLISPEGIRVSSHGDINLVLKENNLSISTMKSFINKGIIKMKNKNNKHNGWEIIKFN